MFRFQGPLTARSKSSAVPWWRTTEACRRTIGAAGAVVRPLSQVANPQATHKVPGVPLSTSRRARYEIERTRFTALLSESGPPSKITETGTAWAPSSRATASALAPEPGVRSSVAFRSL